jgi:hypothetical protein
MYEYDLQDGLGTQSFTIYRTFKTNPSVALFNVELLNTEAIMENDLIVVQINIDNFDGLNFTRIMINDVWYNIANVTNKRLTTSISASSLGQIGSIRLTVQRVEATLDGITYTYYMNRSNTLDIIVNGDILLTGVTLLDDNLNPLEYLVQYQTFYIELKFDNPTGYTIVFASLNDNNSSFTRTIQASWIVDANTVLIPMTYLSSYYSYDSLRAYYLSSFQYSNEIVGTKTKQVSSQVNARVISLRSAEVRDIATVDQLKNIQYVYNLDF